MKHVCRHLGSLGCKMVYTHYMPTTNAVKALPLLRPDKKKYRSEYALL